MTIQSALTQNVTNASGTIAIASTSTSLGVAEVVSNAPVDAHDVMQTAQQIVTTADMIGMFSATVLAASFMYNMYATRKKREMAIQKNVMDEKFYVLRLEELELEKAKFKQHLA